MLQSRLGTGQPQFTDRARPVENFVTPCRFAQCIRVSDRVANIIGNLVGFTKLFAECTPWFALGASCCRARLRRCSEQGTGFCPLIHYEINFGLAFPCLTGNDPAAGADRPGNDAHQFSDSRVIARCCPCKQLESEDNQPVADEHREFLPERLVHRDLSSPAVCIIKARQIVMNERGAVEQLNRGCRSIGNLGQVIAAGVRDRNAQARTNSGTSRKHGIAHGRSQPWRRFRLRYSVNRAPDRLVYANRWIHDTPPARCRWLTLSHYVIFNIHFQMSNFCDSGDDALAAGSPHIAVIGAGIGGLAAASLLSSAGSRVTVLEKEPTPGGKMREIAFDDIRIDAGPTVFTMRWVFDEIAAAAGAELNDLVTLRPASVLARHVWEDSARLDLFADVEASAQAIREWAGAREASGYLKFCDRARDTYRTLEHSFIRSARPSPASLVARSGLSGAVDLWRIAPFRSLWGALGDYFPDPRLRQLFGRYATYCGSSPFEAPATLMLIAHVEQAGVWLVEGGMHSLAQAFAGLADRNGATLRYNANVAAIEVDSDGVRGVQLDTGESIMASAVVANADIAAVAAGQLGPAVSRAVSPIPATSRSLSAVTVNTVAAAGSFPLARHTVFFSNDYPAEFNSLFKMGAVPDDPTVYICAQDRDDSGTRKSTGDERLFLLINAPANGDSRTWNSSVRKRCEAHLFHRLEKSGLHLETDPRRTEVTTPAEFHRLFPGTGGALYGRANHGWKASFQRPTARTRVPGLYLVGGSVHPGAGVPMAALSGKMAADAILKDCVSIRR